MEVEASHLAREKAFLALKMAQDRSRKTSLMPVLSVYRQTGR